MTKWGLCPNAGYIMSHFGTHRELDRRRVRDLKRLCGSSGHLARRLQCEDQGDHVPHRQQHVHGLLKYQQQELKCM